MKGVLKGLANRAGTVALFGFVALGSTTASADGSSVAARVAPLAAQSDASLGVSPEQRLQEELRVLLLDMIESGAFGQTPSDQISLSIDSPKQRATSLGVLVDSSAGSAAVEGLQVVGTTPGSSASRLGLQSGDVIASVNGVSLAGLGNDSNGGARAALVLRDQLESLPDDATIEFKVIRDGRPRTISGAMASAWIPALHLTVGDGVAVASAAQGSGYGSSASRGDGCGRLSIFDNAPRQQNLHAAALISIDGERSPMGGQEVFRLSEGRHVLTVGEKIESRYLAFSEVFRNSNVKNPYKTLEIDVAPNTTYFLAAKLIQDKRNVWRDGAYWEPVIWSQSTESCK
ncbi:PDZ domain-containing protein [Dokdonella sp.]|uniref:PDZ domain-containing protein n=1 Tax=Dokdonella sp. TaxID=2291710 RepID=UPI003526F74A